MVETVTADYLVIGAGAMGMAFVDTLISDTNATVVIVDRYARPGGHWTIAYPFVRLHQPSAFYGVNSRPLGGNEIDQVGWNKGLAELATVDEICAYYSVHMNRTLLPSGRVQYYAKHEYIGEGRFRSLMTNKTYDVSQTTKIVDATFMKVRVPAMCTPSFSVADGVTLVTPNNMTTVKEPYGCYTVIGGGKTGIDTCLWLLAQQIQPEHITWIIPRDSWYFERGGLQPGPAFAESTAASIVAINTSIMEASSPEDLFLRLEACGQHTRLDESRWPTMFRCATVSLDELRQIRKISNIVRKGRVLDLDNGNVTMENGEFKPVPNSLYIDCTADGLAKLDPVPVFNGRHITLQSVRYCQQVFSAAFIAHVESAYSDDNFKNDLCQVIPHPDKPEDYLTVVLQSHKNGLRWNVQPQTAAWLAKARLDWFGTLVPQPPDDPVEAAKFHAAVAAQMNGLCEKLQKLIDQFPGQK